MSDEAKRWLGKRVRVGAGCAPEVTLAEGTVVGYLSAPSIIVRDAEGRDSTWQVTLPIDVLGEVPVEELPASACGGRAVDTEPQPLADIREVMTAWLASSADDDRETLNKIHALLPASACGGRTVDRTAEQRWNVAEEIASRYFERKDDDWNFLRIDVAAALAGEFEELPERAEPVDTGARNLELRSQLYHWLGMFTACYCGAEHDHGTLRHLSDQLAQRIEQLPMPIEDKLDAILRGNGIEYPLGLRGVRDLVNQRDGHRERAEEAEELASRAHEAMMVKYAEAGQLRDRAERVEQQLEIDRREHGRSLDAVQRSLEQATARAEEAERRLANVRVMVERLRHAEPVGSASAGYCLVRIEDMLNGQEPA